MLVTSSCSTRQLTVPNYLKSDLQVAGIRHDGYFSVKAKDCEECKTYFKNSIIFTASGQIANIDGINTADELRQCETYKRHSEWEKKQSIVGRYILTGDTLKAFIPYLFIGRGNVFKYLNTNFEGVLSKNGTAITNWHIVEPYPPAMTKFIVKKNLEHLKVHTLTFNHEEAVQCLDISKKP